MPLNEGSVCPDESGYEAKPLADHVENVINFCDFEGTGITHSVLSDNLQMRNCEISAWEVMRTLDDFDIDYGQNRAPDFFPNTEFKVVQHKPLINTTKPFEGCNQDVVCLCMDVSGSMLREERIIVMSEAVQLYILSFLRNGSAVGIVSFASYDSLHADMTEITSRSVRERLMSNVPTQAGGGTNIADGLNQCKKILQQYTQGNTRNTRILLHSDGQGNIGDAIQEIIDEGIILDTVLFDQGGYLADKAVETGGNQYLASDDFGQINLLRFYEETASRYCKKEEREAVVKSEQVVIKSGQSNYHGIAYFDATIGMNTKLVFKADVDVQVNVSAYLSATVTEDSRIKAVTITIEDLVDESINYTITKRNPNLDALVTVTITSAPVPGVEALQILHKVNSRTFEFGPSTQLISYIGVFQGFSPVSNLQVGVILEDPTGTLTDIPHSDDGTGMDAVPNDGFYTGALGSHNIIGQSDYSYYGLDIGISGEGVLPEQEYVGRIQKRCTQCNKLGTVSRSLTGKRF
ncbi:calcium-activated chloride channel regulator 1-like [Watersipora subatra]|uniref:calcium-activated chloride channel regulator 1-like n=1 Tax=Watersipora subatra TaxID=2589382 RepID=UPI00355B1186